MIETSNAFATIKTLREQLGTSRANLVKNQDVNFARANCGERQNPAIDISKTTIGIIDQITTTARNAKND